METITLNLIMPKRWQELTEPQLALVYSLLAQGMSFYEIRTLCLLRWNNIRIVAQEDGWFFFILNKNLYRLKAIQIFELVIAGYEWPDVPPKIPLRLSHIPLSWWQYFVCFITNLLRRGRTSQTLPPDFRGVELQKFLYCDNLYQGYLCMKDETILDRLTEVLYPSVRADKLKSNSLGMSRVNSFFWFTSIKDLFSRTFDEFIRPAEEEKEGNPAPITLGDRLQRAMDTQIRALTKGDITKESVVLSMDTWRAFTELNAQAKEFRELKERTAKT